MELKNTYNRKYKNDKSRNIEIHTNKKLDINNNLDIWIMMDKTYSSIYRNWLMELAQYGLTPEQARVLYTILAFGGSATLSQISFFTNRQLTSVSVIVSRMTKGGLVRKERKSRDKLQVIITEKGQDLFKRASVDSINMIFSSLSLKERQNILDNFVKMQGKARNLLGVDYTPPFLNESHNDY